MTVNGRSNYVNITKKMKNIFHNSFEYKYLKKIHLLLLWVLLCGLTLQAGCSPAKYRKDMDKTAEKILSQKQLAATGKTSPFSIERPSDILRRKLLIDQNLPISGQASLGTDKLTPIKHWPEKNYPTATISGEQIIETNDVNKPLTISLVQALQIGAYNSFEYQNQKEAIFQTVLALRLEQHAFESIFSGQIEDLISTNTTGERAVSGMRDSGDFGVTKTLKSGAQLGATFAIDLVNLLTLSQASSMGLLGDATVSIPLLRGSGEHIVTEPLIQADRNVIYAFWDFEQYKKNFAVDTASNYLSVLQQLDTIKNNEADYRSRIASAQRSRKLADAGRVQEIEVDQAVQNELSARQRWITATQTYKNRLDSFKTFLGLPPDANIELEPRELELLVEPTKQIISRITEEEKQQADKKDFDTNDLMGALEPDYNTGPYEFEETTAIKLAFENRSDLRTTEGKVYDKQRAVVVAADALGAELTLLGSVESGARRNSISTATAALDDSHISKNKGVSSALLTMNLPVERTEEAVNYRKSYIALEQAVRDSQIFEDNIKIQIRTALRDLLVARENMYIQAKAVYIAQKRVKSVNMFLEAGRAQIRDLLEAQDALLAAQNSLTAAVVNYRIAELRIQRDAGVLQVDEKGLWQEYYPGENQNDKEENISG
jgi:outer membrane protein TolC